ncbi:E3 ubiquitin-protein ligase TRIP12 [Trypanosoma rangeli]|uniref:E3 ubiquitin-protein ligase TRIP12 n=1 Tax=Trypanosoma rangeli TaxID=5698 RepID=A0A422NDY5_TRYRA|nr:E3 ubiquitin-protein ligase TRIP12 [Trypanosoma rangeli]RNF03691.1 E3 ubiquitin-protein ligase TRIP12 [Trypanosoma rangeli]|eukprot:RNF03691.1 E3 ubiquitin-protein ligase TRIP12 [Trypanosoma rangeli]
MSLTTQSRTENSRQQLRAVHLQRKCPDKAIEPLEKLCMSLVMGVERYLRSFDAAMAIPMLLRMTERETFSSYGDALTLLFRALALIMEYVPSSHESVRSYHKRLMKSVCQALSQTLSSRMKYSNTDNVMLMEESLRLIHFITKDEGNISVLRFGMKYIIRIAASENTLMARQAFAVLLTICSKITLPSDAAKPSLFRLPFLFIGNDKSGMYRGCGFDLLESEETLRVTTVETVLIPFLHSALQQYAANLESFSDAWSFLEQTLQCLSMLMRRSMLCHRPSTTRKIVTREMCCTVFQLLLSNDTNVALEQAVRSDRLLLCETVLGDAIAADSLVTAESLLCEEAVAYYKLLLEEQDSGLITQLDDPFPIGSMASRNTQRRDRNNIVSIAAIRLFVLACPCVLSEAFGPKPKVLLPVHQWYWEDEIRHSNAITEEACVTLETGFDRLCKEVSLRLHMKAVTANFQTMKLSSGFGSLDRNILRKIVPFVFHFVNETDVRIVKAAKEAMLACNPAPICRREAKSIAAMETVAAIQGLDKLFILNKTAVTPAIYMCIAEVFLEDLCGLVLSVSGQMAMQLGTSACASLLQAAICTGEDQRLESLLCRIIRPFCEMLREALVSGDKATKSVSLTMMVWLLCHPRASTWKFSETALRCGVVNQLEIMLLSSATREVTTKAKGLSTLFKKKNMVKPTRTAYLAASALTIHRAIKKQLLRPQSPQAGNGLSTTDVTLVETVVNDLKVCAAVPGLHQNVVAHTFEVMEKSVSNMTVYEMSTLGIADAVLNYLLGENYNDYCSGAIDISAGVTPSAAQKELFARVVELGSEERDDLLLAFGGQRTAKGLHQKCQKERLQCFLECAMQRPRGVKALIENLVSTIPLRFTLPLVESLLGAFRVSCRSPVKAVFAASQISPIVSLCCKPGVASDAVRRNNPEKKDCRSTSQHNMSSAFSAVLQSELTFPSEAEEEAVHPRENCPRGHRLHVVVGSQSLCFCDICEEELHNGLCCQRCAFHICKDCYTDPKVQYEGGIPGVGSRPSGGLISRPAGRLQHQRQHREQLEREREGVLGPSPRAHLFASIGDIERHFRTGSSLTRNTDVAPAPQSVLQNIDFFVRRAKTFLARKPIRYSEKALRQAVCRILNSFSLHGPIIDFDEAAHNDAESLTLSSKELQELTGVLQDAMEERYVLYTAPGGRCAYQETLIGNFLQRALHEGSLGVVEQLETCLLNIEGYGEPSTILADLCQGELLLLRRDEAGMQSPLSDMPTKASNAQTYTFHHFETDEDTRCVCGTMSRKELNSTYIPKLMRKPSRLSRNADTLLLILLQKLLHPLIKQGIMDIDAGVFVSAPFTTLVVKALAASALRVALLPPRLAVPRWTDFVITEASFLLPLNVRERIARFFAYDARRALHNYLRSLPTSRSNRFISIYPAEWGRWANHKFRVNRASLLHDAYKVLRKSADSRLPISIEFEGDVGVGQGPTAHFYTLIAEEVKKANLNLWRNGTSPAQRKGKYNNVDANSSDAKVEPPAEGLYPVVLDAKDQGCLCPLAPQHLPRGVKELTEHFFSLVDYAEFERERTRCYYLIGAALGRAFTDEMVFPLDLSPALAIFMKRDTPFPRILFTADTTVDEGIERPIDFMDLSLDDVELMDRSIAASVRSLLTLNPATLESLSIPFTLPGHDNFEMVPGGAGKFLTNKNCAQYIRRVCSALLYEAAVLPIRFLVRGFRDIVPCESLAPLDVQETMSLLCGCAVSDTKPLWTLAEIKSILVADHGYQNDSPQMTMLQNILANRLTPVEQRSFLLFCTGCPRLPVGGVGALGAITVVRRSDLTVLHDSYSLGDGDSHAASGTGGEKRSTTPESGQGFLLIQGDWPLPSVNTCFRYLKLPPYPTEELMYNKLRLSITQGGETFQLS